jgi:hypothetical protein
VIAYHDFVPRVKDRGGFLRPAQFETLRASIFEANRWIKERNIRVFNVETVVLPNLHQAHEEGSEDVSLRTSGEMGATWHQFIRVWFELDDGPPPMP